MGEVSWSVTLQQATWQQEPQRTFKTVLLTFKRIFTGLCYPQPKLKIIPRKSPKILILKKRHYIWQ